MGTFSSNILPASSGEDLGNPNQRWDAFIQNLDFNGTITGSLSATSINNVKMADQFPGADAGAKITAALSSLASGGVVDCRGFGATTQVISSTISLGVSGKRTTLIFDPATKFTPASDIDMFLLLPSAEVHGLTVDVTGGAYTSNVIKLTGFVYDNQPGDHTQDTGRTCLDSFTVFGGANTTATAILLKSVASISDFIQFCNFSRISIMGMKYGIRGIAQNSGWINGNLFEDIRISNAVHGISLEQSASGAIDANSINDYQYEWAGNFSSNGLDGVNLSGICRYNRFLGLNIWDMSSGGGRASVRTGTGAVGNLFVGHWNQTLLSSADNNDKGYDSATGTFFGDWTWASGTITSKSIIINNSAAPTVAANQIGLGSTTASTVGAAGGASALPATPLGYLIINVAGTAVKVPYYNS